MSGACSEQSLNHMLQRDDYLVFLRLCFFSILLIFHYIWMYMSYYLLHLTVLIHIYLLSPTIYVIYSYIVCISLVLFVITYSP